MQSPTSGYDNAALLMNAAANGDKEAADRLLPLVYEQLRKAAELDLAGERSGHTLSATALVHEAYLKLVGPRQIQWAGRGHFYAAAVVQLRFYAGLGVDEAAEVLGLSPRTAARLWSYARAVLYRDLNKSM